jgi:hypothetical protein
MAKIKFNHIEIILRYKDKGTEKVWLSYRSHQITTPFPNINEDVLKARLEACPALIEGCTEFPVDDGKFSLYKKRKYKKKTKK